jgi:hypothetical protein
LVSRGRQFEPSTSTSLFEHLLAYVFLADGELENEVAAFTIYAKEDEDDAEGVLTSPSRRRKKDSRGAPLADEKMAHERKQQRKRERKELKLLCRSKTEQYALAGLQGANKPPPELL